MLVLQLKVKTVNFVLVKDAEEAMQTAFREIAEFVKKRAEQEADAKLNTTKAEYVDGLNQPESVVIDKRKLEINLIGDRANALEGGWLAFDMKPGLLAGKPYADVPFTHLTPGAKGGMSHSAYGGVRKAIASAGEIKPKTFAGGSVTKTLRTKSGTKQLTVTHKTGKESGMMKAQNPKKGATYLTIRRVSEHSDPKSWINPGFEGIKLFSKLEDEFDKAIPQIMIDAFSKHGIELK